MASADYRLCDVCGRKAFYDARLDYGDPEHLDEYGNILPCGCGDWAVICESCAKTHETVIRKKKASKGEP